MKRAGQGPSAVFGVVFAIALAGASLPNAKAEVEEARSFAMEAADPHIKQGFLIRGEPWSGKVKPGGRKIVRHQLFRGNEYWFWLGCSTLTKGLTVRVYDRKGRPVHVETLTGEHWAAARVLPPKTGTYLIVVSADKAAKAPADWSLSYGYR